MIEAVPLISALPRRPAATEVTGPEGFSYTLAATSLEARAGAALQAFGAREGAAEIAAPDALSSETSRAERAPPPPSSGSRDGFARSEAPPAHAPVVTLPQRVDSPTSPAPAAPISTDVPIAVSVAAPAASPLGAVQSGQRSDALARDHIARPEPAPRAKPAAVAARTESPLAAQDFARLLAKRLDAGVSHFDLRLDPPELGRIEARLVAGDDGRAELSLSFDNPAAYDLFRRDEAGLRAMLLTAGFDLGAGDLAFSLKEHGENRSDQSGVALNAGNRSTSADPVSLAAFSRGVIDLLI